MIQLPDIWLAKKKLPDIWRTIQGLRRPGEPGGMDSEVPIRDGYVVNQAIIEKPIGIFRGNHSGVKVPGSSGSPASLFSWEPNS